MAWTFVYSDNQRYGHISSDRLHINGVFKISLGGTFGEYTEIISKKPEMSFMSKVLFSTTDRRVEQTPISKSLGLR